MRSFVISQKAYAKIAQDCLQHRQTETGAVLLGGRVGHDLVVPFVVLAGPRAHRSVAAFHPDHEWQQRYLDFLFDRFGVNYAGDVHRHPGAFDSPSGHDLRTARQIVTDPAWNTPAAAFPIVVIEANSIRMRPFLMERETLGFRELPLEVVPDTDLRILQLLVGPQNLTKEETNHAKPTRLLIAAEALASEVGSAASAPLYGLVRRSERLIQVLSQTPRPELLLEKIALLNPIGTQPERDVTLEGPAGSLTLRLLRGGPKPETIEIVDVASGLHSRRSGLIDAKRDHTAWVAVLGAGSVGSQIALLLAEAGVGPQLVMDRDVLDATNLSRHACDLLDLGRTKARAVEALVKRRGVDAAGHQFDLLELDDDALDGFLKNTALVVATCDSPAVQFRINEACVRTGTTGLFVGAYERACGGEVIVVRPGEGPCLYCAVGFRAGLELPVDVHDRRQAYQAADAQQLAAEPGLGADISHLVSVATAYALALLDPSGCRSQLLGHDLTFVHGGSEPREQFAELFRGPFDLFHASVRRNEPCPVCDWLPVAEESR